MSAAPVLRLSGITKRFGALVASDDISLELARGEVLALLGENGAGKSTLVSILFGHYVADAGSIEVEGRPLAPGQPAAALAAGIGMVHQHFTLADNLTVLDNVMLGTEPLWRPWSGTRAARERLLALAGRFGLAVEPAERVGDLSVGERQRVEILKALYRGARLLILDEPTAVLTPAESEALFATLGQMVQQGLSIVFISHKLQEVLRVSHRVAVLRAGRLVAQADARSTTPHQLARWMIGGDAEPAAIQQPAPLAPGPASMHEPMAGTAGVTAPARAACRLVGVSVRQGPTRDHLHDIELDVRAGEIVGIAGVAGNGQTSLAALLFGTLAADQGQIEVLGAPPPGRRPRLPWPVRALVARGVARIPEDRQGTAAVGDLSVTENIVAERLHEPVFSRGARALGSVRLLRRDAIAAHAADVCQRFDVRGAGPSATARQLSGGNLQKLVLGRVLHPPPGAEPPGLIVAHQPTWGLDVGAVAAIHARLREARARGAAVLVLSDDLDEILALCDRLAVIHGGRLTPARPVADWTREAIGLAMAAHAAGHA